MQCFFKGRGAAAPFFLLFLKSFRKFLHIHSFPPATFIAREVGHHRDHHVRVRVKNKFRRPSHRSTTMLQSCRESLFRNPGCRSAEPKRTRSSALDKNPPPAHL